MNDCRMVVGFLIGWIHLCVLEQWTSFLVCYGDAIDLNKQTMHWSFKMESWRNVWSAVGSSFYCICLCRFSLMWKNWPKDVMVNLVLYYHMHFNEEWFNRNMSHKPLKCKVYTLLSANTWYLNITFINW